MRKRNDKQLAEGEVTGHAHVATSPTAVVYGEGVNRLLEAPDGTPIKHEEHKEFKLPPGNWKVTRQREVDPEEERRQQRRKAGLEERLSAIRQESPYSYIAD